MKILYLDQGDFLGGAELFSVDVLRTLRADPAITVTVATNDTKSEFARRLKKLEVKVAETPLPKLPPCHFIDFGRAVSALRDLIKKEKPDLVHTNTNRAHLIAAVALYRRTEPPLTWMLHDFDFTPFFIKKLAKVPRRIGALPAVIEHFEKIIPKQKAKFAPIVNGLDFAAIKKVESENLTKKMAFPRGNLCIGFVGRITRWKGVHVFVEAATQLLAKFPHLEFFVAGSHRPEDAHYLAHLSRMCEKSLFKDQIHFLGWQEHNLEFIKSLDILVHASVAPEPFGRTVIEGMALGTPVVATQLGGPKNIIHSGENGFLVPPENPAFLAAALEKLIASPQLRTKIALQAQKDAQQNYQIKQVADSLADMWCEAMGRNGE